MTVEYLKSGKPDAERAEDDAKTRIIVEETLKNIEINGDAAVRELSIKFDNYAPENFKLSEKEISDLIASLSDRELSDIKFAQEQVRNFAQRIFQYNLLVVMSLVESFQWWLLPICQLLLQQLRVFLELLPVLHLLRVSLMLQLLLRCIWVALMKFM